MFLCWYYRGENKWENVLERAGLERIPSKGKECLLFLRKQREGRLWKYGYSKISEEGTSYLMSSIFTEKWEAMLLLRMRKMSVVEARFGSRRVSWPGIGWRLQSSTENLDETLTHQSMLTPIHTGEVFSNMQKKRRRTVDQARIEYFHWNLENIS